LRIVFVLFEANLTGGVRTVATYARLLKKRGHQVTVISTPPPARSLKSRLKSVILGRGWPRIPPPPPSHLDDAGVEHRRLERFRPVADRDVPDADVVIATWWLTAEWVAALSPRKGAKVHFIQGDEAVLPYQPKSRIEATWRLPFRRIVCSNWLLGLARNRYGDDGAACVPNGVDLEQFSVPPRTKQARPTVGFLYYDTWMKGCDVAVAAYQLAARRLAGLHLLSFGILPVNEAAPLPTHSEFILRPSQRRIAELYASCDAWLWPSREEGFGLPILEAMACRTPVIACPAGAAPELLAGGGGILLPSAEPQAMARAIEELTSLAPAAWREISDQAHACALRHDWAESARLFEAELEAARQAGIH